MFQVLLQLCNQLPSSGRRASKTAALKVRSAGLSGSLWGQNYFHNPTETFLPFHWVDIYTQRAKGTRGKTAGTFAYSRGEAPSWLRSHCIFWPPYFLQFTFYILKNTYVKNISLKNSQFHPEVLDDAVRITLYYIWPLNPCFLKGQWQVREHRASAHPHSHRNSVLSESNRGLNQLPQGSPFLFRRMYDKLWLFRPGY